MLGNLSRMRVILAVRSCILVMLPLSVCNSVNSLSWLRMWTGGWLCHSIVIPKSYVVPYIFYRAHMAQMCFMFMDYVKIWEGFFTEVKRSHSDDDLYITSGLLWNGLVEICKWCNCKHTLKTKFTSDGSWVIWSCLFISQTQGREMMHLHVDGHHIWQGWGCQDLGWCTE